MKNLLFIIAAMIIVMGGYLYVTSRGSTPTAITVPADDTIPVFAPEVEKVLSEERAIIQLLANDRIIVEETRAANERDKSITEAERAKLDTEWQNSEVATQFIMNFLENKTANLLLDFQKTHQGYKEIFTTNAYGLNVGQTDKTSDYYQADEEWWVSSFNSGVGKLTSGRIEFDESSQTESISIYAPIIDSSTGKAIGVLKAVLDVYSLTDKL